MVCILSAAGAAAQTPSTPPFPTILARRGWHLDLTVHSAFEVANYNGNHEEMFGEFAGFTYGIREGLAIRSPRRCITCGSGGRMDICSV